MLPLAFYHSRYYFRLKTLLNINYKTVVLSRQYRRVCGQFYEYGYFSNLRHVLPLNNSYFKNIFASFYSCSNCRTTSSSTTLQCRPRTAYPLLLFNKQFSKLSKSDLWSEYQKLKSITNELDLPVNQNPDAMFVNNELDLEEIDVYGFDYDYTLALYQDSLKPLIYHTGLNALIKRLKYPKEISNVSYDPGFAIRGLHCDVQKGLLMKIDAFHNIQQGTVYRGLEQLSDDEVKHLYDGTHIDIERINNFYGRGPHMHQLMDLFALPELTLYANVVQYFNSNGITFDPEYVFYDVRNTVQNLHADGTLHSAILDNLDLHVGKNDKIAELLRWLSSAGKKLFLITNSGFQFVNRGMSFLVGSDWHHLFDVIVTNARKPKFFNDTSRPFRKFNPVDGTKSWDKVQTLKKGNFYEEGNFYQLKHLTGWEGPQVLYLGDHVYSDLADATLKHGWRTGAVIPELAHEIEVINSCEFKKAIRWLVALQDLIERMQEQTEPDAIEILDLWRRERNDLRLFSKNVFNAQFGSVFRTYHNPTYFTRRLSRFADVYMSNTVNLLNYSLRHTLYPRRAALPHETCNFLASV